MLSDIKNSGHFQGFELKLLETKVAQKLFKFPLLHDDCTPFDAYLLIASLVKSICVIHQTYHRIG